jgi:hypothetical protein
MIATVLRRACDRVAAFQIVARDARRTPARHWLPRRSTMEIESETDMMDLGIAVDARRSDQRALHVALGVDRWHIGAESASRYNRGAMKPGSAAIILLVLGASIAAGPSLGCGSQARPVVQPDEPPPLPPTSGTPIGHLIDSSELTLSDAQLGDLKVINDELARQLEADDRALRPEPAPAAPREEKPRGLGFHAAGRADGMGGGSEAFPGASTGGNAGDAAQTQQTVISAATANQVYRQRARHVRDAVQRALALLDPGQQAIARRVLSEHGVNLDTGEVSGSEPGASQLEEPKLGQPLPREP